MKRLICLAILCLFILMGVHMNGVSAQSANYTTNSGTIYKNGAPIILRGSNWFGMENSQTRRPDGLDIRDYRDMIAQMKSLGFNSVRLPYCPSDVYNLPVGYINTSNGMNADLAGLKSLDLMDKIVAAFNAQQMYVILDMHSLECSSTNPFWYSPTYSENQWVTDLLTVADHFRNYEYFMGIDLKNEPHYGVTWSNNNIEQSNWKRAVEKAGSTLLTVNSNILIFVEGIWDNTDCTTRNVSHWWGGNIEPIVCYPIDTAKIPANKLVLAPHVYGPDVYPAGYFFAADFPNNMKAIWDTQIGFAVDLGYTLAIGEWGGKYGTDNGYSQDKIVQDKLVDYFVSKHICNSFWWSWNPNASDTGGILQNDWYTPWSAKINLLHSYFDRCNPPTPTPSSSTSSSSSSASSSVNLSQSTIQVFAAGTVAGGVYPAFDVLVDNQIIKSFSNVRGDTVARQFQLFELTTNKLTNQKIRIQFTNDISIGSEDRNLRIDKIVVDGKTYESENQYSEGTWTNESGNCNGGYKNSEWLHCTGFFEYPLNQPVSSSSSSNSSASSSSSTSLNSSSSASSASSSSSSSSSLSSSSSASSSSSSSVMTGSTLQVIAAGTPMGGIYPSLDVYVKGVKATSMSDIRGDTNSRTFVTRTYVSPSKFVASDVKLVFSNDQAGNGEDRNVLIDKIILDGVAYESEASTTLAIGSWTDAAGCGATFVHTEWLHCPNGAFSYNQAVTNQPTTTNIVITAAGTPVGGEYPTLDLVIKGQVAATFTNIRGNPEARNFETRSYVYTGVLQASDIRLQFTNDIASATEDRNVRVDKINLNGIDYQTESPNVTSVGSWDSGAGCGIGNKQSEWLHCAGYFQY